MVSVICDVTGRWDPSRPEQRVLQVIEVGLIQAEDPSRPEPSGPPASESAQARLDMTGWPVTGPGLGGCRAV